MKKSLSILVALLVAAAAITPLAVLSLVSADSSDEDEEVDFNDRFAVETRGSRGEIEFDDQQEGSFIEISEIEAEGLQPDHQYEIWVTVSPPGPPFANVISALTAKFGPFDSDEDGELEVEELEVSVPDPGSYRVDVFLTHIHPTACPSTGLGADLCGLLGTTGDDATRDVLLACQPALLITLEDDEEEEDEVEVEVEAEGLIADFGLAAGGVNWIFAGEWELEVEMESDVEGEFSAEFTMVKEDGTSGHTMILTDSVITELGMHGTGVIHVRGTVDIGLPGDPMKIADDAQFHIFIFPGASPGAIKIEWEDNPATDINEKTQAETHLGINVWGTVEELETEGL